MVTDELVLNLEEVVALLGKCVDAGVMSLQWRGLKASFFRPEERKGHAVPIGEPAPPPLNQEQHDENTRLALLQEEMRLKRDQLANALIEDPLQFEELIMDGEVLDESDDDESTSE